MTKSVDGHVTYFVSGQFSHLGHNVPLQEGFTVEDLSLQVNESDARALLRASSSHQISKMLNCNDLPHFMRKRKQELDLRRCHYGYMGIEFTKQKLLDMKIPDFDLEGI